MIIDIRITGPAADEDLNSLHRWLRDEPSIRQNALIKLTYQDGPQGTLGPVLDTVQLVLNDGLQIAAVLLAYRTWRDTRPPAPNTLNLMLLPGPSAGA